MKNAIAGHVGAAGAADEAQPLERNPCDGRDVADLRRVGDVDLLLVAQRALELVDELDCIHCDDARDGDHDRFRRSCRAPDPVEFDLGFRVDRPPQRVEEPVRRPEFFGDARGHVDLRRSPYAGRPSRAAGQLVVLLARCRHPAAGLLEHDRGDGAGDAAFLERPRHFAQESVAFLSLHGLERVAQPLFADEHRRAVRPHDRECVFGVGEPPRGLALDSFENGRDGTRPRLGHPDARSEIGRHRLEDFQGNGEQVDVQLFCGEPANVAQRDPADHRDPPADETAGSLRQLAVDLLRQQFPFVDPATVGVVNGGHFCEHRPPFGEKAVEMCLQEIQEAPIECDPIPFFRIRSAAVDDLVEKLRAVFLELGDDSLAAGTESLTCLRQRALVMIGQVFGEPLDCLPVDGDVQRQVNRQCRLDRIDSSIRLNPHDLHDRLPTRIENEVFVGQRALVDLLKEDLARVAGRGDLLVEHGGDRQRHLRLTCGHTPGDQIEERENGPRCGNVYVRGGRHEDALPLHDPEDVFRLRVDRVDEVAAKCRPRCGAGEIKRRADDLDDARWNDALKLLKAGIRVEVRRPIVDVVKQDFVRNASRPVVNEEGQSEPAGQRVDVAQGGDGVLVEVLRPEVGHHEVRRQAVEGDPNRRLHSSTARRLVDQFRPHDEQIAADGAADPAEDMHVDSLRIHRIETFQFASDHHEADLPRREVVLESLVSGDAVTTCTEVAVQHRIRAAAQVVADGDRLYD